MRETQKEKDFRGRMKNIAKQAEYEDYILHPGEKPLPPYCYTPLCPDERYRTPPAKKKKRKEVTENAEHGSDSMSILHHTRKIKRQVAKYRDL